MIMAFLSNKTISSDDALKALKCDPAVLEAQVTTLRNKTTPEEVVHSSAVHDFVSETKNNEPKKESPSFEKAIQETLLLLKPQEFIILMMYTEFLRRKRNHKQHFKWCSFCKKNGEDISFYGSHSLKNLHGRVLCPVLRSFQCPRCFATGDHAHTIKYCPLEAINEESK